MPPKVSIILPCYNGAKWLSEAIASILAQTYQDFELLIIDDGSTDNSKVILSSYLVDERVRYIYQENKGFSGALNRGLKESKGDLIGFICSDDLWLPNKLDVQVKYFVDHDDTDLVHANYYSINSDGQVLKLREITIPSFASREELIESLFFTNFIGFETVLLKNRCFEVGFFDESMVGFSDHDMWLRIAGKFKIAYIDLPLVKKREHDFSLYRTLLKRDRHDQFLLVIKTIPLYPFLKKVERKKLASLYFALGLLWLQKGNEKKAKQNLRKAIRCQPWQLNATAIYLAPSLYAFIWRHHMATKRARSRLGILKDISVFLARLALNES